MLCHLVIKSKTEASSLITAYKGNIVAVMETHGLQIVKDFAVVGICFLRVFGCFFLVCVTAERKSFFGYIHSYVNDIIIHLMTSICMR